MIEIVYEDDFLLVAVKPVTMSSQKDESGLSAVSELEMQLGCTIYPLHRLDKMVSGLIIYAKDSRTAGKLSKALTSDFFDKDYLAVVENTFDEPRGMMNDLLFYDRKKNKSFVVNRERNGVKDAFLTYEVIQQTDDKALVKVHLITGRTHQIRVQFSHAGHPLCGDGKYGSKDNHCTVALFSHQLTFKHPITNRMMYFRKYPESRYPWNLFDSLEKEGN